MTKRQTCEHCGTKFNRGEHFVCRGQLVLTVEGIAAAPELATTIRNRTK